LDLRGGDFVGSEFVSEFVAVKVPFETEDSGPVDFNEVHGRWMRGFYADKRWVCRIYKCIKKDPALSTLVYCLLMARIVTCGERKDVNIPICSGFGGNVWVMRPWINFAA
jgi:hypothetical protein